MAAIRKRKDDMVKPEHLTLDQWVASLLSDRRAVMEQTRREIHTRGNCHQRYLDRLDRALAAAERA
jgi:hypothetical protein